jgi:hypothetical protein
MKRAACQDLTPGQLPVYLGGSSLNCPFCSREVDPWMLAVHGKDPPPKERCTYSNSNIGVYAQSEDGDLD